MSVSRLKEPKYLCLLTILYHIVSLLLFMLAWVANSSVAALWFCPDAMLFIFLSAVLLSSNITPTSMTAAFMILLILINLPLIGWFLGRNCKWKSWKMIRIPTLILLIGHVAAFCLLLLLGLSVLFYGDLVYLSVILGVVVPALTLRASTKW
ncbi:MAG: hypothetical protein IJK24_00110 [Oscillospiraceae bacterium]|nr:hypothetical protein [Oscillospiraceae bacterium]